MRENMDKWGAASEKDLTGYPFISAILQQEGPHQPYQWGPVVLRGSEEGIVPNRPTTMNQFRDL